MIYLYCVDCYRKYGRYDPGSRTVAEFARDASSPDIGHPGYCGHYATLVERIVFLCVIDDVLWVGIGGDVWAIDSERTVVRWTRTGDRSRLAIVEEGREVAAVDYEPEPEIEGDITAHWEPEQDDFGLFVFNVANDRQRQLRIGGKRDD